MTASTTEVAAPREVLYCDPRVLAEHPENIRNDLGDVSDIAKTIPVVGIIEPIVVTLREDGSLRVLAGYRRLAAAIEAGLGQVPYIVRGDLASDVDALTTMIVENGRRKDLTASALSGIASGASLDRPKGALVINAILTLNRAPPGQHRVSSSTTTQDVCIEDGIDATMMG